MNRRGFLRSLFASTATIVVAPASALEDLDQLTHRRTRSFFDMGKNRRWIEQPSAEWVDRFAGVLSLGLAYWVFGRKNADGTTLIERVAGGLLSGPNAEAVADSQGGSAAGRIVAP